MQECSQAAAKDCVVPQATAELSKIGRFKASRDFMRGCKRRCSFMRHVSVYRVPMPFIRRDDLGLETRDVGLLLPHEMWVAMYEFQHDAWVDIFGDQPKWSEFWSRSPWLQDHPGHGVADAVPLRLHGDDAQHKKGLTGFAVMVLSWGSPLSCFASSIASLLLIMTVPLLHLTEETLDMLYSIVAWSFNIIAAGKWPDCHNNGRPWTSENQKRRSKQGQFLASGIVGFIVKVLGNWKWLK